MNLLDQSISVIMPIRGQAPFLSSALDSILRQAIPVSELLVIDDGMHPDVQFILDQAQSRGLVCQVLKGPQQGPAAARNVGIMAARGGWLTFLDDDDLWPDDKLMMQAQYLLDHPEVIAVSGKIHWFHDWDECGRPIPTTEDQTIVHVNLGAYLLRRELIEQIGSLDASLMFSEDVDFILRIVDGNYSFAILPQVTLLYRRHPASMTAQKLEQEKIDYRRVLFASLKRRRHQQAVKLENYLVTP